MAGRKVNGAGTINYDASNDRYRGRIMVNGKRFAVYGKTKTATQAKLNAVVKAGGTPNSLGASDQNTATEVGLTVSQLVAEWRANDLASRDRAASTVDRIAYDAKHIDRWLGQVPAKTLTTRQIERGMLDGMVAAGLSHGTCVKALTTLRQSLKYACRRGELERNVAAFAVIPAAAPRTAPRRSLTADEARTLLDTLRGERNGLLFALSLRLGLRPGEAAALYWDDLTVDDDGNTLVNVTRGTQTVQGRTRIVDDLKTSSSKRTIAASTDIAMWIIDHRKTQTVERLAASSWGDDQLVFASPTGNVLSPPNTRRQLDAVCATITAGRQQSDPGAAPFTAIRPNELRHSCLSLLSAEGVSNEALADLAGHTTTRMVDEVYRHQLHPVVRSAAGASWAQEASS